MSQKIRELASLGLAVMIALATFYGYIDNKYATKEAVSELKDDVAYIRSQQDTLNNDVKQILIILGGNQ